jgi:FMN-dependent NADH-azoreductase
MQTGLYVSAHLLYKNSSYSLSIGEEFSQSYRDANSDDEVIYRDLYSIEIPNMDSNVFISGNQL